MPFAIRDVLICHELHQTAGLVEGHLQALILYFEEYEIKAAVEEYNSSISHCAEMQGETIRNWEKLNA